MPRYSNYGSLDNVMVDEGDVAFNRVNARLRPDQLKEGDVAYSSNGRMDLGGAWQPRKGITNFDTAITLNTAALRLPFYLYANTTASSYSEAAGVITINFATAHPFVNGTLASISGLSGSTPSVNGNRTITVNSSTQIEITVAGLSGSITGTAVVGAPRLEDDAVNSVYGSCLFSDPNTNNTEYIVIATTEFAYAIKLSDGSETPIDYYHQRRLWMPFLYTTTGSSGSPTITSRDVTDEIIASDVLDQDTYDQIYANYRIASGGADYVVALQPFTEDNLVVFNRNTIHLVRGVSGALESTTVQEVTREVGCLARRSVVQVGNQILFLSDNGIYAMTFEDLYNLRGASIPLSEPINPLIKRINKDYAKNSVAIYHDNRYYIAVPIDDSTENNAILVYNFLNQGWESLDTVDAPGWNIRNLIRAGAGSLNKLYAVNSFGGIHILEDRVDNNDVLITQIGQSSTNYPIQSYMTTRQYTAGTMDRKRYNSFELQAESSESNDSDIDVSFESENPDSVNQLDSLSDLLGETLAVSEDASVRGRIGNVRGYGGQFTLTPTLGRPKIRAVKVSSQLTDLNISSKQ
jgi:hypothetical protein